MSFYTDFADYSEAVFPFDPSVHAFLREHMPPGARRALDVGCGTGDYTAAFANDGLEAVGIDLDLEMGEVARARHVGPLFRVMDAREVGRVDGLFDVAFSIGNVVSHLEPDDLPRFLDGVHGRLERWGTWIVQMVNWDYILGQSSYRFPDIVVGDGAVVFTREYPQVASDRVQFVTRLARGDTTVFEGEMPLYPISTPDCEALHDSAGFELLGHYADFHSRPFDPGVESSSVYVFRRRG
jgi:SAM-dependent methyltransferase